MRVQVYPEACCEVCCEIVRNYIDCPVCKASQARTDACFCLYEEAGGGKVVPVSCECGAKFEVTMDDNYDLDWKML